ncbi:unnamed protein product [Moneuplotes crassus]|uniref:Uncharacterized protein n=1 Tax=Euplotes crassus TaxID=5936 RepID=A0AAD1X7W6_EUPCR|nr:unnamed protein product [Moneuplotes crassus]
MAVVDILRRLWGWDVGFGVCCECVMKAKGIIGMYKIIPVNDRGVKRQNNIALNLFESEHSSLIARTL